ncbi:hypothetical protein F2P79_012362 [Pimephales promelas]|nr:hypothetical protein F2P79_012362 [Pimephales promelas]
MGQGCPNSVLEADCPTELRSRLSQHSCCLEVSNMPTTGPKTTESFEYLTGTTGEDSEQHRFGTCVDQWMRSL